MTLDEQNIREIHATWINAVNFGDIACLLTLMTEDVVFLNPGKPPLGKDEFSEHFSTVQQRVEKGIQIECTSVLEEVVIVGEVTYTRSRDTLLISRSNEESSMQLAGHRITIYRKQSNRRWLLARDIHTLSSVV